MQGKVKKPPRMESLLEKVSEYDIYRHFLGFDFKLNESFKNPFYPDSSPGLRIFPTHSGVLYHYDWGDESFKGTCVDLVRRLYGLDHRDAILKIDSDMKLGIFESKEGYQEIVREFKKPEEVEKKDFQFQVVPRKFNQRELKYWEDYYIGESDILSLRSKEDVEIYALKQLFINKKLYPLDDDLVFGYLFSNRWWKIYFPFKDKKKKWRTNVNIDHMYGLSNIPVESKNSFILKSVKDWMVVKTHVDDHAAGTQNESEQAINPDNIQYLLTNCENNYVLWDNDEKGKSSCAFFNSFGLKYWNVPKSFLPAKDPSDLIKQTSPKTLREEISKKIQL